jgi:hypothetical protein
MADLVDALAILDLRIDNANLVLKKRRQVTAGQVAILVDRSCENRSAVDAIPRGIVGSSTKKRDTKGGPADNHRSRLLSRAPTKP